MAVYVLSGNGIQALNPGKGLLKVEITTFPDQYSVGTAYPENYYHAGLLRIVSGDGDYMAFPLDADVICVPLPANYTGLGYSVSPGGEITVTEVTGDNPWRGPPGPTGSAGATGSTGPAGATGATGPAGAEVQTLTHTVDTDSSSFLVAHTFDLGHPSVATIKATLLAFDPDGETFSGAPPGITMGLLVGSAWGADGGVSLGGSQWVSPTGITEGTFAPNALLDVVIFGGAVPRYLRPIVYIMDTFTYDLYAGANHPTAQVRLDVEFV